MRKVIVHVEDNEGDAFLIKQGFRKLDDIELVHFERGGEALSWLEESEAALILVDWFLPDMEGDEFVSRACEASLANKPQSLAQLRDLIAHLITSYGITSMDADP